MSDLERRVPTEECQYSLHPVLLDSQGQYTRMDNFPTTDCEEEFREKLRTQRLELLKNLEHNETGIDTPRVAAFLSTLGMRPSPYVVIPDPQESNTARILARNGITFATQATGKHLPNLGATILSGQGASIDNQGERTLAHEWTHANGISSRYVIFDEKGKYVDDRPAQQGFRTHTMLRGFMTGYLAEEAFGVLVEGGYAQHIPMTHESSSFAMVGSPRIPSKYVQGAAGVPQGVFGAIALELIGVKEPELMPLLLRARKSLEGIQEFKQLLDEMGPGLSDDFFNANMLKRTLTRGVLWSGYMFLRRVRRLANIPVKEAFEICKSGPVSSFFAERMRECTTPTMPMTVEKTEPIAATTMSSPDPIAQHLRKIAKGFNE